jgi:hypothetical protein
MTKKNQKKLGQLLPRDYGVKVQALYKKAHRKDISRSYVYLVANRKRNNVLVMNILCQLAEDNKLLTEQVDKRVSKLLKPRKNAKKK